MSNTPQDIAWAAGVFNCHGYIRTTRWLTIRVRNKDRPIHDKLQAILGGSITGPYRRAHRDQWEWTLNGDDARAALRKLLPYLVGDEHTKAAALV